MPIVAITREMGSLGTFIAKEAARRLAYEFVRQDITRDAAREYEVLEEHLVGAVEERPGLFEVLTHSARRYQEFVAVEVLEAAQREGVVIVGRWSTFLLRGIRHAVRVRVCAPLETRIVRIMERLGVDRAEALRRIRANDEGVRARVRQVFEAEWSDPLLYDLSLNTDQVSLEAGVAQLLGLVAAPEFQPTEASRQELRDRALTARVRAALRTNRETARLEVGVRVERGRVTLAGTLFRDDELAAALRVARGVEGVTAVASEVQIVRMPVR